MSNVIDFLEQMGQNASLRHAARGDVSIELERACIDPEIGAAILARDAKRVQAQLGRSSQYCLLFPGC